MNLRTIANRATSTVNPNIAVTWRAYAGYSTLPSGKTAETYAEPVPLVAQVQALTKREIQHIEAMNLSPCDRAAYVNGQLQAFDRVTQTGGDFLYFENRWWKVMAILEGWTTAGWCKVALVGQNGGPT